jgi:hypothetical protein
MITLMLFRKLVGFAMMAVLAVIVSGDLQAQTQVEQQRIIEIIPPGDSAYRNIIQDLSLYTEGWDTLSQPKFWQLIMNLDPELSFINIASNRRILDVVLTEEFDGMSKEEIEAFKDSVCGVYGLEGETQVYITSGKKDYYQLRAMVPTIDKAIGIFEEVGTDPWFAQAILLIESPGQVRMSSRGAYGHFQLMKSVARSQGLVVTSRVDERKDLDKSAKAAAKFIGTVCLPHAREMMDVRGISYSESDLWFRLLVLHVYHAGAANVRNVLNVISPSEGGMELIRTLWRTESANFRNASQNYSQIALASLLELDKIIYEECQVNCPPLRTIPVDTPKVFLSMYDEISNQIGKFFFALRRTGEDPPHVPEGGFMRTGGLD